MSSKISIAETLNVPNSVPAQGTRARAVGRWVPVVGAAILIPFFLPAEFLKECGFGQEESWRLFLNKAFSEGWSFGNQIIWTYGPLGFLESRFPYGVSLWYYVGFDLLIAAVLLGLCWDMRGQQFRGVMLAAGLAGLLAAKKVVSDMPSCALFCACVLLILRNLRHPGIFASVGIIVSSVVLFFLKLNFGFLGWVLSLMILLFKAITKARAAYLWLGIVASQMSLVCLLAGPLHVELVSYVTNGLAVIAQYSDAMSWESESWIGAPLAIGLLTAASFAGVGLAMVKHGFSKELFLYATIIGTVVFTLFKTAMARSDEDHHRYFVFGFPLLAAGLQLYAPEPMRAWWRALFVISAAASLLYLLAETDGPPFSLRRPRLAKDFGWGYVKGMGEFRSKQSWASYVDAVRTEHPERRLPDDVLAKIGSGTVDIFPFESALVIASGCNYRPRPMVQSYWGFGRFEDAELSFFHVERAPQYILYALGPQAASVDGRYHLLDEPALKRLIQADYRRVLLFTNILGGTGRESASGKPGPVLLLERSPARNERAEVPLETTTVLAGTSFPLPQYEGELYARIKIKKTIMGRILSTVLRGTKVQATFQLEDGTSRQLSVIPRALQNGVLVNRFAREEAPEDSLAYLTNSSDAMPKCVRLAFHYRRGWEYQRQIEISYFRSPVSAHD